MNGYHFGKGTIKVNGAAVAGVECGRLQFESRPAEPLWEGKILNQGVSVTVPIDSTLFGGVDFGPAPTGPQRFKVAFNGDEEKPMLCTLGEPVTDESGAVDIPLTTTLIEVKVSENRETGEVLYYAVTDGGYEQLITKEAFIELTIQMSNGVDPEGFRADLDEILPRSRTAAPKEK